MLKKKTLEISLLKFKNVEIVYITPKNQLWGIFNSGLKKCITKNFKSLTKLFKFFKNKNFISYKDSLKIKKDMKFNILVNGVEIIFKKKIVSIDFLNTQNILKTQKSQCLKMKNCFKFVDLFSGMGSFHYTLKKFGVKCVLAIDNDINCNNIYYKNFGVKSEGNILNLKANSVPEHDILCGGFPCQPFSVAGLQKGFLDKRSNVIWKIFEILRKKNPRFIILENVKGLLNHDKKKTFLNICNHLKKNSYFVKFKVLNTKVITNIPQNRERLFILGFKNFEDYYNFDFNFINKTSFELKSFLESDVNKKYYYTKTSKIYDILKKNVVKSVESGTVYQYRRGIVRENKSNVCPTLVHQMGTGGHNVPIILDSVGIRKLTPRECLRLQGFFNYDINGFSDSCIYKLCGNSITIDVLNLIFTKLFRSESKLITS